MPPKYNINEYNKSLTPEKRVENARRAGSTKKIKKAADIRRIAKKINEAPASENLKKAVAQLGIEDPNLTNAAGIVASVYQSAISGDMGAVTKWEKYVGQSDSDIVQADEQSVALSEHAPLVMPAELVPSHFSDIYRDILGWRHTEYMLKGGRGSVKSSFIALCIVLILENNPDLNAVILRKIANTLRTSVFNTILWALDTLGVKQHWKEKLSPMEITNLDTGQVIYFFGLDDPLKLKSIKPKTGYNGLLWFEELDQFAGPEEIRSVKQSVIRGGDRSLTFMSFNPPKTRNNWANVDADIEQDGRLVSHSDYRSVPREWLGESFLNLAETTKKINPKSYEHEYLGIPNGNGGMIFDNVVSERITDEQIKQFDRLYNGVDWGWFPDPWAFNQMHYDSARQILYIFGELRGNKLPNKVTAQMLKDYGLTGKDLITADSAEQKSVADYQANGLYCIPARKGPGSVDYSMKWLQSLAKIVIDPARCPWTFKEFTEYEYERDKDGNIITGYPDHDNHNIDAVRYAMEAVWKWQGK